MQYRIMQLHAESVDSMPADALAHLLHQDTCNNNAIGCIDNITLINRLTPG